MVSLPEKKERLDHRHRRGSGGAAAAQGGAGGDGLREGWVAAKRTRRVSRQSTRGTGAQREQGVRECGRRRTSGAHGRSPRPQLPVRVSERALKHESANASSVANEQRTARVFVHPRDVDVLARVEDVVLARNLADVVAVVIVDAGLVRGDTFEGDVRDRCSKSWVNVRRVLSQAPRGSPRSRFAPRSVAGAGDSTKKNRVPHREDDAARERGAAAQAALNITLLTGMPSCWALSRRFSEMPEPGKPMTPLGSSLSSWSFLRKGAARPWAFQSGLHTTW